MANPQVENGYLKIANEIAEKLSSTRIPGEATQVLWCIFRKTYGYGKKEDRISLSQFCQSTGIRKQHVCRAIVKLLAMNMITKNGNDVIGIYKFNKNFDTWKVLPKKVTLPKLVTSVTKKGNKRNPKRDIQKIKDNITKDNAIFPEWINPQTWQDFLDMRKSLRAKPTPRAIELLIGKLTKFKAMGYDPNEILKESIEKSYRGVFEPKEKPPLPSRTVYHEPKPKKEIPAEEQAEVRTMIKGFKIPEVKTMPGLRATQQEIKKGAEVREPTAEEKARRETLLKQSKEVSA